MKYNYLAGGILISSDIYFPEMVESNDKPEVELLYGNVPDHLEKNNVDFPFIEANENQYLLKLPNVGKYLVENGNRITIEAYNNSPIEDLEKHVLTTPFAALSYQRNLIPMHGGVFLINGKGILISGLSGNGKSTLLAGLFQKGYKLISDDISNIKIIDGKAIAYPCFPRLMLWKDTIDKLNLDLKTGYKLRSDLEKYLFPIDVTSISKPVELSKIIILNKIKNKDEQPAIKGMNKIATLSKNTFKPWMAKTFWNDKITFQLMTSLASFVQIEEFENDKNKGIEFFRDSFIEKFLNDVK